MTSLLYDLKVSMLHHYLICTLHFISNSYSDSKPFTFSHNLQVLFYILLFPTCRFCILVQTNTCAIPRMRLVFPSPVFWLHSFHLQLHLHDSLKSSLISWIPTAIFCRSCCFLVQLLCRVDILRPCGKFVEIRMCLFLVYTMLS